MSRLPQGSAEILLAVHICLKKRSDRQFAPLRGELCNGRNDPSRQPRLASCNYSFGKRRERYRGFESPRSTIQSIVLRTFRRIARNRRVCARFAINAWTRRAAPAAVLEEYGKNYPPSILLGPRMFARTSHSSIIPRCSPYGRPFYRGELSATARQAREQLVGSHLTRLESRRLPRPRKTRVRRTTIYLIQLLDTSHR